MIDKDWLKQLVKEELKDSYLLTYCTRTDVILFLPDKHDAIQEMLARLSAHHAGCCYHFSGYSVALWQDLEDAIGFRGDVVCALEFFEQDAINREFYWRHNSGKAVR